MEWSFQDQSIVFDFCRIVKFFALMSYEQIFLEISLALQAFAGMREEDGDRIALFIKGKSSGGIADVLVKTIAVFQDRAAETFADDLLVAGMDVVFFARIQDAEIINVI